MKNPEGRVTCASWVLEENLSLNLEIFGMECSEEINPFPDGFYDIWFSGSGNQKEVEKVNGFESPPVAETPGQLQTSPEVEEGMPNFYSQEQLLPATYRSIAIPTAEDLRYILDFFKTFLELLQIFFWNKH